MKRKKYLACLLAMSMMLASVSPMAVSADAQDVQADVTFEDELDTEGMDVSVDEEIETSDADTQDENTDESLSEYTDVDLFSSGEDFTADVSSSDTNEGWTPLTTLINENRILYRYDENEKTLYFKCTEPIAIPDYNYGNRTDWFVDLGADKIAQIEKIVIGDGITGIGKYCFQSKTASTAYTNLKEVVLSDSVKTIGKGAFGSDSALNKINLENITSVGMAAFAKCALEQVNFSSASIEINTNAFKGCPSLNTVKAKEISCLGESAFEDCTASVSYTHLTLPTN